MDSIKVELQVVNFGCADGSEEQTGLLAIRLARRELNVGQTSHLQLRYEALMVMAPSSGHTSHTPGPQFGSGLALITLDASGNAEISGHALDARRIRWSRFL